MVIYACPGSLAVARAIKNDNNKSKQLANNIDDDHSTQQPNHRLIVPKENGEEASRVPDVTVYGADNLAQVCEHLKAEAGGLVQDEDKLLSSVVTTAKPVTATYTIDLADVKGQHHARRALEIAAAGGHSLLFTGPPGSGKTLMASRLPTILPSLTDGEALEVASTYSVANTDYQYGTRPFREIHHTISSVALVEGVLAQNLVK